jgi:hypothetical protein
MEPRLSCKHNELELCKIKAKETVKVMMIFAVLICSIPVGLPQIPTTQAWGLATHMWMVEQAIDAMPAGEWQEAFEFFAAQLKAGSITPDVVWQDWDNHLYYPHTEEHSAHLAVERWFGFMQNNLSVGAWNDAMFAAGVMSHYFTDPNIPVHTDENWAGHSALETDINYHLATFSPTIGDLALVENPSHYLIQHATIAHDYYDECRTRYPTGTIPSPSPLDNDPTFHGIIEGQLSNAITGLRNLWYTAIQDLDPPTIPTGTQTWTVLIDEGHDNAYTTAAEDQLSSFKSFLTQYSVNIIINDNAITPDDLQAADLLIITAPFQSFTTAEINTITDWIVNEPDGHMLFSGYSDYYSSFVRQEMNWLLGNLTSHIQLNDDQVFASDSFDPGRPWYCDIDNVLPGSATLGITTGVNKIRMFSTSSLWYTDPSAVTNITFGDPTFYQDMPGNPPPPVVIYDTTADTTGGDSIPLMAVDAIGDSRIFVSGTTFFSNFDYGATDMKNDLLVKQAIEWLLDTQLQAIDVYGPEITAVSTDPTLPSGGSPIAISANVTDPAGVENVTLYYQLDTGPEQALTMNVVQGAVYQAIIPGIETAQTTNITYYIKAFDTNNNWRKTFPSSLDITPGIPVNPLAPIIVPLAIALVIIVIGVTVGYWLFRRRVSNKT